MIVTDKDLIHLAYGVDPKLCDRTADPGHTLYYPHLWHAVPAGLKCPDCDLAHANQLLHGLN